MHKWKFTPFSAFTLSLVQRLQLPNRDYIHLRHYHPDRGAYLSAVRSLRFADTGSCRLCNGALPRQAVLSVSTCKYPCNFSPVVAASRLQTFAANPVLARTRSLLRSYVSKLARVIYTFGFTLHQSLLQDDRTRKHCPMWF